MSYADTGDDELDYGEGELGVTASGSLGAPQDDNDDMAQADEYDDLYDDVNIGYFEAPTAAAGDGYSMDDDDKGYEQRPDVKPTVHIKRKAAEHVATVAPQIVASGPLPLLKPAASLPQPVEVEQEEELQDDTVIPGVSVRLGASSMCPGLQTDSASRSVGAVDGIQGRQMQLLLSPHTKEQGARYNNGAKQGGNPSFHSQEKTYSPARINLASAAGNGDTVSGSIQTNQVGGHAGGGFSVGPVRTPNDMLKERGVMDDKSYAKPRGTTTSLPKLAYRDVSPIMVENENLSRPPYSSNGNGMLFVGELHWWTTDAELEAALSEYGRVRNLKFFEERVSGKSKGYCQVEFYDHVAAVACKHGMNGRRFHDRPCLVALGNPKSIQQLGFQQDKKTQAEFQAQQEQMAARRNNSNSGGGNRGGLSHQERDSGHGYGRMGSGRMGMNNNKAGQGGGGRGRGNYMNKGMRGGGGSNAGAGMPYGQGHTGPIGSHQSAMMMHQGMMGQGYDPAYGPMGRGVAAYGGYVMPGPPFPGMVAPFAAMGPGGLAGVAPHVNPAFFGRPNGMGLMPGASMEGPMWGDASLGWGRGEEQDRRTRDGSYMDDGAGMDYGYNNDMGHEKSRNSGTRDKENGDWSERHRRDDRDADWEREGYKEKGRDQRDRDRHHDKDEEWDQDRPARPRYRSRVIEEEDDPRHRLREEEYGRKRSRMMEDRM